MLDVEHQRHAEERGAILRTLKEDFQREMTTVRTLLGALDAQAVTLSVAGITFHLKLLESSGYVRLTRARDLPGYRRDRWMEPKPDVIVGATLTPAGLQLLDGLVAEDPLIKF